MINTSVEPFIQRMLQPADPKLGADLVSGAIENFSSAYQARQRIDAEEKAKQQADPNYVPKSGFSRFTEAWVKAPGVAAEGETAFGGLKGRIYAAEAKGLERQQTLNEQTDALVKDPLKLAQEIGDLTPDQVPDWVSKHAGLAANPIGKTMLDSAMKAYHETTGAQIKAGQAKHLGDLATKYPNLDLTTPEGLSQAQRNESVHQLYDRARIEGKLLNQLPDEWFNPDGTINEQKAVPGVGALPRSETLQSREDVAAMREEFNRLMGREFAPGPLQKDLETIDAREKAGLITAEDASNARRVREGLEPKASSAGQWMQRTEVQTLTKRKEALIANQIAEEQKLDDIIARGGFRSEVKAKDQQRKVDFFKKRIEAVDKEIDAFRPKTGGTAPPAPRPVLPAGVTRSMMDTNVTTLRKFNPATGKLE